MNGGIRWVALKEDRESVNGGRYDRAEAFRKGIMKNWEERTVFLLLDIFLVLGCLVLEFG